MNAKADGQKKGPFLTDIEEIRRSTREHIEKGAVTPGLQRGPEDRSPRSQ